MIQDNDMTDKKKKYQIKCYYLTLVSDSSDQTYSGVGLLYVLGNTIDSGMDLSITIDTVRVFINKTLSVLSVYQ